MDDVSGEESRLHAARVDRPGDDQDAGGDPETGKERRRGRIDRHAEDSDPPDRVLLRIEPADQAIEAVALLHDRDLDRQPLGPPQHGEPHRAAHVAHRHVGHERSETSHGLIVEPHHDVPDRQSCSRGRPARNDVLHQDAPIAPQPQSLREHWIDLLARHADRSAVHVPVGLELPVHELRDVAGDGEPKTLAPAALTQDERVDPDELPLGIHQRTTGVSRVDGRVRLDVDDWVIGIDLPGDRADHAHGHGVGEPRRTPEGERELALVQPIGVAEAERP